jgi:hypothetical protein
VAGPGVAPGNAELMRLRWALAHPQVADPGIEPGSPAI